MKIVNRGLILLILSLMLLGCSDSSSDEDLFIIQQPGDAGYKEVF